MGGMLATPRYKGESSKNYAFRLLRHNILTLRLAPGALIRENEIAEQLHLSRTPVREALLMLTLCNLVEVQPRSNTKVSTVRLGLLREGYFLRRTVEPAVFLQASESIGPRHISLLQENLAKQREILKGMDGLGPQALADRFFELDEAFHKLFYEAAGKEHVWQAVSFTCTHYDRARYMDTILMQGNVPIYVEDHAALCAYVMTGAGPEEIGAFFEKHMGEYRSRFSRLLAEYPAYFLP